MTSDRRCPSWFQRFDGTRFRCLLDGCPYKPPTLDLAPSTLKALYLLKHVFLGFKTGDHGVLDKGSSQNTEDILGKKHGVPPSMLLLFTWSLFT